MGPVRRDGSLTVLGFRFDLPETLRRHFLRAVAAAAFLVLVAAATSASCRGISQQNIAFQMFLQLQALRRPLSRPVAAALWHFIHLVFISQGEHDDTTAAASNSTIRQEINSNDFGVFGII